MISTDKFVQLAREGIVAREDSVQVELLGETATDIRLRLTARSTYPLDRLASEYGRKKGIKVERTGRGTERIFIFDKEEARKSLASYEAQAIPKAPVAPPEKITPAPEITITAPWMVQGEAFYTNRWDTDKLGQRVDFAIKAGWVNKQGQLTKLGEKIAYSKWVDLSPAAQNVLRPLIDRYYGKAAIPKTEAEKMVEPEMIIKKLPSAEPQKKPSLTSVFGQDPYYFTVAELRQMCQNQGLSTKGNKDELVERLFKNSKGFTIVV